MRHCGGQQAGSADQSLPQPLLPQCLPQVMSICFPLPPHSPILVSAGRGHSRGEVHPHLQHPGPDSPQDQPGQAHPWSAGAPPPPEDLAVQAWTPAAGLHQLSFPGRASSSCTAWVWPGWPKWYSLLLGGLK